jgi:DNA-binding NtrC family response regulator
MTHPRRILILDISGSVPKVVEFLAEDIFATQVVTGLNDAQAALEARLFDTLIADVDSCDALPLEVIKGLREKHPETALVMVVEGASVASILAAVRAGVVDCLVRPFEPEDLIAVLERTFEFTKVSGAIESAESASETSKALEEIVGASPAMRQVFALARKVANSRSTVLITGESGTGKEVVARSIHYLGSRAPCVFEAVNVAAIPDGLLEAELFGHEKGAFTGADRSRTGLFERTSGGTLFLDEIGDLSLALQAKLLRVLQERKVRAVGSERWVEVDTRIIAATHRNLEEEVAAGRFREDLYYRLNVIPIHIPPLREHPEDIRPLAEAFIRKHADRPGRRISDRAVEQLALYPWKGNIRELENTIERALALAEGDEIDASDLLFLKRPGSSSDVVADSIVPAAVQQQLTLRELEDRYIQEILHLSGGRKREAAQLLGIDRRTLYRRTTD